MKAAIVSFLVLCGVGVFLIALPDEGPRLFAFSEAHGPGVVDGVGIVLVLAGWSVLAAAMWKRRKAVTRYNGTAAFNAGMLAVGLGYGLIIASVVSDFSLWWLVGIGIVALIHTACLIVMTRKGL
ncbi:hypothetical protein [Paenibacillus sp.]|uniref:hypothetical protein n=1 Tax=Paenibacillus sp. TaxID=58172 RepID=UPI002D486035|nr:hypothetical protein [Paenibacillus sp.]HZG86952.1 hypothetical protein [Paenibacillus sp.]